VVDVVLDSLFRVSKLVAAMAIVAIFIYATEKFERWRSSRRKK
jgi:flagellar biogenesis protein FliO